MANQQSGHRGVLGQIGVRSPIGPVATTRMAGPRELIRREDTILERLQGADTIEVIEIGMTLSRNGLLLVELERTGTSQWDRSS
jgi:hypothetical protein